MHKMQKHSRLLLCVLCNLFQCYEILEQLKITTVISLISTCVGKLAVKICNYSIKRQNVLAHPPKKMAKTKVQFILGACFLSGAAAVLTLVSLGTQNWVQADAELISTNTNELSYINYGLFSGLLEQNYGTHSYYKLDSKLAECC